MNITWNGLGSIVLTAKPGQSEVSLVTNPFVSTERRKFPRQIMASCIVATHDALDANNFSAVTSEHEGDKNPFVITHAGEYEVNGVFVTGIEASKKDGGAHTIYRFDVEGMHIGFLGALDRPLSSKEQESLGAIDILLIPAGGHGVLGASEAAQVTAQIEPRIVIPLYVGSGEHDEYTEANVFVREVSAPSEIVGKLKITRAALPEEDMRIVVLANG